MTDGIFLLKIFSPQGLLLEERVTSVTLPGEEGEIGVLPLHARYLGNLGTGVMTYEASITGEVTKVVISGGFAHVRDNELQVITDYVRDIEESGT